MNYTDFSFPSVRFDRVNFFVREMWKFKQKPETKTIHHRVDVVHVCFNFNINWKFHSIVIQYRYVVRVYRHI